MRETETQTPHDKLSKQCGKSKEPGGKGEIRGGGIRYSREHGEFTRHPESDFGEEDA